MSAAPNVTTMAAPADASSIPVDLPERVSAHMETHFRDDVEAGGWICARDYRDNTAVVVWRRSGDLLTMAQVRGMQLYRWACSLRDAGFAVVPRTDMEAFGRPDEEAADGIARWLHVTGWQCVGQSPARSIPELAAELRTKIGVQPEHTVVLDPATAPTIEGRPVVGFRFRTWKGRLVVTVDWGGESARLPHPPHWVLGLAREHEGHGEDWCRPSAEPVR